MMQARGVNLCPERQSAGYDAHCPLLPGDLNIHKSSCKAKLRLGICKPGCQKQDGRSENKPTGKKLVLTSPERLEIISLYENGASIAAMTKQLHRTSKTISEVLRDAGLLSRPSQTKTELAVNCPWCGVEMRKRFYTEDVRRHREEGVKLPWVLCSACNKKRKEAAKAKKQGGSK